MLAAHAVSRHRGDSRYANGECILAMTDWLYSALRFYQGATALQQQNQRTKARNILCQTGTYLLMCLSKVKRKEPLREALTFYVVAVCFGRAFQVCKTEVREEHRMALEAYRNGKGEDFSKSSILKGKGNNLSRHGQAYKCAQCSNLRMTCTRVSTLTSTPRPLRARRYQNCRTIFCTKARRRSLRLWKSRSTLS